MRYLSLISFALVFVGVSVASAQAASSHDDVVVTFRELQRGHKDSSDYIMATVRPRDADVRAKPENQRLARSFLKRANEWTINIYRERYTHMPAEKYEEMRRKGIKLSAHSSFSMIFKLSDPEKPLATLWTAFPDADGKIELERSLNWNYPHPEEGQVAELKRFVMDRESPREFMPALLSSNSNPREMPAEYALHCDNKLIPIYTRLGFTLVQQEPIQGDFVMNIKRSSYVNMTLKWREKAFQSGWNFNYQGAGSLDEALEGQVRANLRRDQCPQLFAPAG